MPISRATFKNHLLVALVGIASLLSCNSAPEKMNADPTPEELMQMNKDFAKALNAKNAKAAAELYSEDALLLPPVKPSLPVEKIFRNTGRAALIRASLMFPFPPWQPADMEIQDMK